MGEKGSGKRTILNKICDKNFGVDWSEETLTRGLFIHDSSNIFNSFTLIDTPGKNSDGEPLKHAVIFK